MLFQKKHIIALPLIFALLISCKQSNQKSVEVNNQTVKIIRFDSLLTQSDTTKIEENVRNLYVNHPAFMNYYAEHIIQVNPADTFEVVKSIQLFLQNPDFKSVNNDVAKTFASTDSIQNDLITAYSLMNKHFPQINTPEIYFFVSGFNSSILLENEFVGIGLDLYLGNTYPRYSEISYDYLLYNMRPASIAPDLISAMFFKHFSFDGLQNRLLEQMLYRGKLLHIVAAMLPNRKPNDIIGYSRFQWEWSRKFEKEIWNSILAQRHLYSSEQLLINKYLNDAPFTTPITQDSPGRLGAWVGWQIINSYMKNNNVSLQELAKITDYQMILNKSKYKP